LELRKGVHLMRVVTAVLTVLALLCLPTVAWADMSVGLDWEMRNRQNILSVWVDGELGNGFAINLGVGAEGSMEGPDKFTTRVDEVGGSYSIGAFKLFGGLINHSLGTAKEHPTFLGPNSPAFLNVGYEVSGDKWTYMKLLGDLRTPRWALLPGEEQEEFKRLGLHYLRLGPWGPLTIGVGEAVVFVSPFDGDILYTTLPVLPYYFAKYMPGIKTSIDNSLFYGDGTLELPGATFYGELLVNEFPMNPGHGSPKLFAVTLGAETDSLIPGWNFMAEYTYITDRAYSNKVKDAAYSVGDRSLGHPLGDDLMGVDLQAKHYWEALSTETTLGVYHLQLGNAEVRPWDKPAEEILREKVYGIKLEAKHWLKNIELRGYLDLGYTVDYRHEAGKTGIKQKAVLSATWYL
jgi:hypothetical protein